LGDTIAWRFRGGSQRCIPSDFERLFVIVEDSSLAYSQYSAELQLRTLRIDADTIEGQVLDIGCGPTAVLVHHLRLLGQDAWGIDRNVIRSTPYLKAANWLDFLYPRRSYGLIASHLAFSSHFLYHISSESEHVPRYRAAYQNIVDALTPAGSFRYVRHSRKWNLRCQASCMAYPDGRFLPA
jgi:SAM-dependent methyltransferase